MYQLAAALDNAQTELEEFRYLYDLANDMDFHMVGPDRLHNIRATPGYFEGIRSKVEQLRQITMHPLILLRRGHMNSSIAFRDSGCDSVATPPELPS